MRLTVDLIDSSPSFINPLKDRELSLRGQFICIFHFGISEILGLISLYFLGHRISMLENLGATKVLLLFTLLHNTQQIDKEQQKANDFRI